MAACPMSLQRLNLSRLPADKKQFAWQWIQKNKPELAELLAQTNLQAAQKAFDGQIIIELQPNEIADMKKKFALGILSGV